MKKILFAWIGDNDLKAASSKGDKGLGAICQAATVRTFDQIVLLSDRPERAQEYVTWLSGKTTSAIVTEQVDLGGDPTDYRKIYENAKTVVQKHLRSSKMADLTFHLSSGTPAMATIWVILANSHFPTVKLIKSSPERGLQDVEFPFDITVDYLPELRKAKDSKVSSLFIEHAPSAPEFAAIIHNSPAMRQLVGRAKTVAPYFIPVLIQGESGTGKELLARAIHEASLCRGKNFVAVNCGAIPANLVESELFGHVKGAFTGATDKKEGLIKAAAGGTLFLDEVGELPLSAQVKLLRVLQEGVFTPVGSTTPIKTDARIISATNRNLFEEIVENRFREDLFHRLAVAILQVPPLREREGDSGLLVGHLLTRANEKLATNKNYEHRTLSTSARAILLKHPWPGNVRELENTLLRAALWCKGTVIDKQDVQDSLLPVPGEGEVSDVLGRPLVQGLDLDEILGNVARHYLERAMKNAGGNKSKASKLLNFRNYQTLDNWLRKYGISTES